MISTSFALAPAGVLGQGVIDARPYACAVARTSLAPVFAGVQGTGVPFAGMARLRGTAPTGVQTTQQHDPITPNDGTTPLGIHSPGRPKS